MRVYNYAPGPAILPAAVKEQLRAEMDVPRAVPLLEMGHRTPEFDEIAARSEQNLRRLLEVPDDYAVLFLPGGARAQYAMAPLNLDAAGRGADYFDTGYWSACAIEEGRRYTRVGVAASVAGRTPLSLPPQSGWMLSPDASYCHYVANETLTGFEFFAEEHVGGAHLASDMTSAFLTRPFDVRRHRLVYAGAQKNAGISGIVIVIVARDALGKAHAMTPTLYNYQPQYEAGSRCSTPPVFSWYVCDLVLAWTLREGGVGEMHRRCVQRSGLLYQCIDKSDIYQNPVHPRHRSRTNVFFRITPDDLEPRFLERAEAEGLLGLRGHRETGGVRASLYNGMPLEGAEVLAEFMRDFEKGA